LKNIKELFFIERKIRTKIEKKKIEKKKIELKKIMNEIKKIKNVKKNHIQSQLQKILK